MLRHVHFFLASAFVSAWSVPAHASDAPVIRVQQTDEYVQIDTDALQARIRKKGYVSGVAQGTFLDKKTKAREAGFGLHIMDFLMAPGWRDDGYSRDPKIHGNLRTGLFELSRHDPCLCAQ